MSDLIVVTFNYSTAAVREIFEPYSGTILQSTLDPEVADQLRRSLK